MASSKYNERARLEVVGTMYLKPTLIKLGSAAAAAWAGGLGGGGGRGVSKLVFYAQSTGAVISGRRGWGRKRAEGVGGGGVLLCLSSGTDL